MGTILILVAWKIWSERNARTFKHLSTMPTIVFDRIKSEAKTWVIAGAKHLGLFMAVCKPIFLGVVVELNLDR
jgi:hypothetical protein